MTFSAYTKLLPTEERLDFQNYSFYANGFGHPVLLRCDGETIVKLLVIDTSKISTKQESFENLMEGMPLEQVSQRVGVPVGIGNTDDQTLIYSAGKELVYLIRYIPNNGILYVESITAVTKEDIT